MFANIAKSAEAVFSRWAVKRLCKFVLKKKLGKFILGDVDLDQLDVQLGEGTIQLSDLALNVDYLNDKFGATASVIIKEGSIGSLTVKMPWKGKGFQVEVDQLELLLAPCLKNNTPYGDNSSSFSQDNSHHMHCGVGRPGNDMMDKTAKSISSDVHEGVKTIAKMVKWFLTNFHVKAKRSIVAFEPYLQKNEKKVGCPGTLVLRMAETECGTCVLEDADLKPDEIVEGFLGMSRLTNFVKFEGAAVELLEMDVVDNQNFSPCASGCILGESFLEHHPSSTTTILTGKKGGYSGNLKLSIPWKNGSLDIRKVDIDLCIDPVELIFQPSTIKWFLSSWEAYKNLDKIVKGNMHCKPTESVYSNVASHLYSSTSVSATVATDNVVPVHSSSSSALFSLTGQESVTEAMLPGSHLIPDWVQNSGKEYKKDGIREELDVGESVEQFFECFDGMRNSQSALGSSGMWNWTCSVFSALTAASNLASGSLHIPSEQQHVQTNFKANLAGISILLSFQDEDREHLYDTKGDQRRLGSNVHYLGAELKDLFVIVQVCPQEMRFEGMVKYIEVSDYLCNENDIALHSGDCPSDSNCQTLLIQRLHAGVLGSLPPFIFSVKDHDSEELRGLIASKFSFGNVIEVKLLSTSGVTSCQLTVNSKLSDGSLTGPTSISLQLPPFIFWVNFWSINMLLDLLKDIGKFVEMNGQRNEFPSVQAKHESSHEDVKIGSCPAVVTLSSTENLRGNISIPDARIILCFPFESGKDIGRYPLWNQFITIDFFSSTLEKGKPQDTCPISDANSWKKYFSSATYSLHLDAGDLNIYLVNSTCKNDVLINSAAMPIWKFCAQKILSVRSSRADHLSTVYLLWQEGFVTCPWIAERARSLVTLEESRIGKKFMDKSHEFATVTSVNDLGEKHSQTREEMILSSAFFLHVHLFHVTIDLDSSNYGDLHFLLDQMVDGLSDAVSVREAPSVSQTSILVECESVEIIIKPDIRKDIKKSLQNELPGSWDCLKLNIQKFDMLSVSNIGGIRGPNYFWLAHGEGQLWGSVTGALGQEFLLISCSNSTKKRGDGGGSNALSSGSAGSDIVYLWDLKSFHAFTSITVRCGTIVAVGGRLDWLDLIFSFFSLPSSEVEKAAADSLPIGDLDLPCGSSFTLELVDVGLSYEPHLKNRMVQNPNFELSYFKDETGDPYVACLLAASSLTLYNTTMDDSVDNQHKIRVQDLGLLLCAVHENLGGRYSVEYLHKMGYVKVAREALIEALLKTNCKNDFPWELECSKSHIYVETCHDTTTGLMHLAAQLQELFAPDLEETFVHLQTRWDNVHRAQERNKLNDEGRASDHDSAASTSQVHASFVDTDSKLGVVGLMHEICEDALQLDGNQACHFYSNESDACFLPNEGILGEGCSQSTRTADFISDNLSFDGSVPQIGLDSSQTSFLESGSFHEPIEGYLSELCPLSEFCVRGQSSPDIVKYRSGNCGNADLGRGNGGWYGDAHLSIVEDHISEAIREANVSEVLEDRLPSIDCAKSDNSGKATGRVLLKNINVNWRMYTGSDWHFRGKNVEPSKNMGGRDTNSCLELALSGMELQYDFFPVDGIRVSKLSLSVHKFYLFDRSKSAPWKLVLGYYHSKDHPRESSSKAFKMELEAVRPDPLIPLEEYRLRVAFLPMILHLHQSQLDFLIGFFGAKSSLIDQSLEHHQTLGSANSSATQSNLAGRTIANEALLPYFQKFAVCPIVLRVDYSPSRVDLAALSCGKYVELVNLVPWKGVELKLKHVHAVGVYGWGSVCETIIGEWLEDISQNQIHKVLRGLPTIRSLVAVGSGAAKLVSLPVKSYKQDQRVLKGMQRGTIAFLRSISLEAVGLGVHLAAGVRDILLQTEYILTSIHPPVPWPIQNKTKPRLICNQPEDAQQGIQQAYESLSDGLGKSASALVQTPLKKYQLGASAGSALATAVRAVPAAAIAPVSACASAAHSALLGIRNSLDPEHKKESMEKYLGPTEPHD